MIAVACCCLLVFGIVCCCALWFGTPCVVCLLLVVVRWLLLAFDVVDCCVSLAVVRWWNVL